MLKKVFNNRVGRKFFTRLTTLGAMAMAVAMVTSCNNDNDIVSESEQGQPAKPVVINLGGLTADAGKTPAAQLRAGVAFDINTTQMTAFLKEDNTYDSYVVLYNASNGNKGYCTLKWTVSKQGNTIKLLNKDANVEVTPLVGTTFELRPGDDCYFNGYFGGPAPTVSGTEYNVKFDETINAGLSATQVSIPYGTGWQKVRVDKLNSIVGSIQFVAQGSLLMVRIKQDPNLTNSHDYKLMSTTFSPRHTFKLADTTQPMNEGGVLSPLSRVEDQTAPTLNYYMAPARVFQQDGYDIALFWGYGVASYMAEGSEYHLDTRVVPTYGGYVLAKDDDANGAHEGQYAYKGTFLTDNVVYKLKLKAKKATDPAYNFLNPLERVAKKNLKADGTFTTEEEPVEEKTQSTAGYWMGKDIPTAAPTGYIIPSMNDLGAAFPIWATAKTTFTINLTTSGTTNYAKDRNELLTVTATGSPETFKNDYKRGTTTVSQNKYYALRFKQGTTSKDIFCCAYRYEFVKKGSESLVGYLKVTSRYLGYRPDITIDDIANVTTTEAFWSNPEIERTEVVRWFPFAGHSSGQWGNDFYCWVTDVTTGLTPSFAYEVTWQGNNQQLSIAKRQNNYWKYGIRPVDARPLKKP